MPFFYLKCCLLFLGSSTNPTSSALSTSGGNNEISARNGTENSLTGSSLTGNDQPAGPSLLPNEEDYRGKSTKNSSKQGGRSQRAQTVLDSFPLLDFMQSHVLSGSLQATSAKLWLKLESVNWIECMQLDQLKQNEGTA